jgi:hypothetical protein
MQYLRIKNYEQYQHYKDRNPPWIKLYRVIMNDYDLRQVPLSSRLAYIFCLIIASETDNRIPNDHVYLAERFGFPIDESVITPLITSGFLLASGARRALARDATCSSLLFSSEKSPLNSLSSSSLSSLPLNSPDPEIKSISHAGNGVATWDAYRASYRHRYSVDPVRNTAVNSQLKKLVDRLGSEEAPLVAAFYCTHNKPLYVSARHATNLLLRDAEGLRTEWATGIKSTTLEARSAETVDAAQEQIKRVGRLLEGRRHEAP